MLAVQAIWDETVALLRAEAKLLIPVALATMLIGDVIATLAQPGLRAGEPVANFMTLLALLLSVLGQLAIIALVLRPGLSVGEALSLAARRLPRVLLIGLTVGLAAVVALLPPIVALRDTGFDLQVPESYQSLPAWALLWFSVFGVVALWVAVRLSTMNALVVDRAPGVLAALRSAFAMTRGATLRLLGVFALYLAVVWVVSSVVRFVFGSAFRIVGQGLGSDFSGTVMFALVSGLVSAAFSTVATVFLALVYRSLSKGM